MMESPSSAFSYTSIAPIRFHQVRPGETPENIASKYNMELGRLLNDNPGVSAKEGEILVINLGTRTKSTG